MEVVVIPCLARLFQQNCDHDFILDDDWRQRMFFKNGCLYIPETCEKCGLRAYEVWTEYVDVDAETYEEVY